MNWPEITIRGQRLLSPFFLAPINTGLADLGEPSQAMIRFHRERSGNRIGIGYVGNVAIDQKYATNSGTLYFPEQTSKWRELTAAICSTGTIPGVQLGCKLPGKHPTRKWRNRNLQAYVGRTRAVLNDLSCAEIWDLAERFVVSGLRAMDVGFRVIEIHAAHGYFLSQLMNPSLNARSDIFSVESLQPIRYILERLRNCAPDIILDVRVSLIDGIDRTVEEDYRFKQLSTLANSDLDIFSLSAGMYEVDRFMIYPRIEQGHALYLDRAVEIANAFPNMTINVAGNIWDLDDLRTTHRSNLTYGIGRPLIADPQFVAKALTGRHAGINHCERAGHCHYYSRGRRNIECKVNASVGAE